MAQWSKKWDTEQHIAAAPEPTPEPRPQRVFRATCGTHIYYLSAEDLRTAFSRAVKWFRGRGGYVTVEEVC